ncbi:crosslink repair DNA glycosylase YcaQ family protein [Paenibacillus sp. LHD-117]|uniref:winged helix-turn-helix domain-containing protein n=1 Tax=Paenibacillus sp. LHD-117 TaxID=3071412 RepID=UPI0027DFE920|nr:crosslink repair DNA glycosylase YcaQ family protein [Paenibacillus sp. LHD-117]MDQ6421691.1 crosslink repair DNA glycosylase YcaQ family protein [Paenibacillus sp. LHD-117]
MMAIQVSKRALRRFLLETQLLLEPRKALTDQGLNGKRLVRDVIGRLECVQIDPVSAVRPNQHLVLAARIPGYEPRLLNELLREHEVFEYFANAACVIPMEDYPLFEPARERMRHHTTSAIEELRTVAEQVLDRLRKEGPLPAKAFESNERVHGYWDNVKAKTKASSHAINLLSDAALIRIVGREGNQRLFDVTDRSVPGELLQAAEKMSAEEAQHLMMLKYFRAYRVFEPSDPRFGWQRLNAAERRNAVERYVNSGVLTPVEVEGLKQLYYVLSSDVERVMAHQHTIRDEGKEGDAAISFLPPLDNLLWSRKRLVDLFDFEYRWEMYTPAIKRKYGYYAMPILAGDRLIGRMDPRLNDKEKHLDVLLLQIEPHIKVTARLRNRLERAVETFANIHGARTVSHYK